MKEVEIKLTKDQYKSLIKLLFIADYCTFTELISFFEGTKERNKRFEVLEKIYKAGKQLDIPEENHLWTSIPLEDEEFQEYKKTIENDFENIANLIFAKKFAKRDLKGVLLDEDVFTLHTETHSEMNQRWISDASKKYLSEFKKNGISNLRFKMFYKLPENENED